jgi:hypothetical protein
VSSTKPPVGVYRALTYSAPVSVGVTEAPHLAPPRGDIVTDEEPVEVRASSTSERS